MCLFKRYIVILILIFGLMKKSETKIEIPLEYSVLKRIKIDHTHPILLESPVLKIVDGVRGLMDETNVHKLIYMCQQIASFQFGVLDNKTKKRTPQHKVIDKYFTLKELVEIEESNFKNKSEMEKKEFQKLLLELKDSFMNLTRPFLNDARGTRQQMYELIKESCYKRKRFDCLLLNWIGDNEEESSFKKNVTSFRILDIFCSDLTNFLKDLLYSCPKARAKFKEKFHLK